MPVEEIKADNTSPQPAKKRVFLALYKGKHTGKGLYMWMCRVADWATRKFTHGKYSHAELAVLVASTAAMNTATGSQSTESIYNCYTSSVRDKGVRMKTMPLPSEKWDLIELKGADAEKIQAFFELKKGMGYDMAGALGVVLRNHQDPKKYFCSEFCWEALGGVDGWRFSPNDLGSIFNSKEALQCA